MNKKFRKVLGAVLSSAMIMTPSMQAIAAVNQFDAAAEDVTGKVVFPGDSITGIQPIYLGSDWVLLETPDGRWTNDTNQAYSMNAVESEEGGLWLESKGYVLTVNAGTSKTTGTVEEETSNHFKAKETTEEDQLFRKDIAYYQAWTDVTVTADAAPDGQVFDHWEVEGANVTLTDAYAAETNFTMTEDSVVLNAVYADAPTEPDTEAVTEAPEVWTEAPEAWTEAPEVWTEAPEVWTEAPEVWTEAPETEENWTDDSEVVVIGGEENGAQGETSAVQTYTLTVENGSGSGEYEMGAEVTITADEVEGMTFAGWYTEAVTVWMADSGSVQTTFSMPAEAVTVTATYTENSEESSEMTVPETDVTVIGGTDGTTDITVTETEWETEAAEEEAATEIAPEEATESETEADTEEEINFVDDFEEITEDAGDHAEEPSSEAEVVETETEAAVKEETEVETEAGTEQTAAEKYNIWLENEEKIEVIDGSELNSEGLPVAKAGAMVTIRAAQTETEILDSWTITRTDTKETVPVMIDEENLYQATFTMPDSEVYIEAKYSELNYNEVQVINGSGSGTYEEGDYVEITANDPQKGYRFKGWKVITGSIELDDASAKTAGFEMPAEAVQVQATYEVAKYTLTVENGSGSGTYSQGETVNLTANYPASGKVFAGWTVTSEKGSVDSADRYYSVITMPAANVSVKATYKDGPSPDYNEIQDIVSGGEYLKGQTIKFTAVGNGMGNTNPNPGDYRYRPSGYQIGTVSGSWNKAPYTTSMAINAVGQYTLTVNYNKDVFDGSSWVPDGTSASKSVTFYVVNALSVQTGDSSPILPLAIAAIAALAVIVILVVVRVKRQKRY